MTLQNLIRNVSIIVIINDNDNLPLLITIAYILGSKTTIQSYPNSSYNSSMVSFIMFQLALVQASFQRQSHRHGYRG